MAPDRTNFPHISPSANFGRPFRKNSANSRYGTFPLCQCAMLFSIGTSSPPVSFTASGGSGSITSLTTGLAGQMPPRFSKDFCAPAAWTATPAKTARRNAKKLPWEIGFINASRIAVHPFRCINYWRRGRDSNPRTLSGQRFSRPPRSTTPPPLLKVTCARPGRTGAYYTKNLAQMRITSGDPCKRRHPSCRSSPGRTCPRQPHGPCPTDAVRPSAARPRD